MAYREEAAVGRKKCPHGLMYDPKAAEGCVLCRRDPGELDHPTPLLAPEAAPLATPPVPPLDIPRPSSGFGPLVAVVVLVAAMVGSWGYVATQWTAPRPGCTSGVDCGAVPAPRALPAKARTASLRAARMPVSGAARPGPSA